jgi:hypothetical protein
LFSEFCMRQGRRGKNIFQAPYMLCDNYGMPGTTNGVTDRMTGRTSCSWPSRNRNHSAAPPARSVPGSGKKCAIVRSKRTYYRSDPPRRSVSGGSLNMRDCGKGPGRISTAPPNYDVNPVFTGSRPRKNAASPRVFSTRLPGSRMNPLLATESGNIVPDPVLESVSRLSGIRIIFPQ